MDSEKTISDRGMTLATLHPDGPVDGVPTWTVVQGNSTLLDSPDGLDAEASGLWDTSLAEGFQAYLVSETLPNDVPGPVETIYEVSADVDTGAGVMPHTERYTLKVYNRTTSLGATLSDEVAKPEPPA